MNEPLASTPIPSSSPSSPAPPERPSGFFQNLIDMYFAPREAFTRIVRGSGWVLPAIAFIAVTLGFIGVWMTKMDPMEFARVTLEESAFWDRIPAEQRAQVIEQTAGRMKFAWINGLVGGALWLVLVAGVLLFVFRFFYAGEVRFKQALAITAWTFFAVGLLTSPLTLAVMGLKGDWNLNPQDVLQANLGLLLDRSTAAKPLWALLTSFDVFSFWQVFLLGTGFGVATRKPTGSALWGVVIPWAVLILGKVGLSFIF
jgi:hypothetical protein